MADYWLAPALVVLRAEVNTKFPNRDKASDGWVGDKRHAATKSRHNPADWATKKSWTGVVGAFDFDNDLAPGVTAQWLWDFLVPLMGKIPQLGPGAELIYNRRILTTNRLSEGARPYSGVNAHKGHIHVSVASSPAGYDSTAPWGISTPTSPAPTQEDNMLVIGKPKNDPQHWIGDGITCRRIANEATLKNIKYLASEGMLTVFENGAVQPIDDIWALGHPIDDDFALTKRAIEQVAVKTGVVIDYAAIAKAVNDEAAKRLGAK